MYIIRTDYCSYKCYITYFVFTFQRFGATWQNKEYQTRSLNSIHPCMKSFLQAWEKIGARSANCTWVLRLWLYPITKVSHFISIFVSHFWLFKTVCFAGIQLLNILVIYEILQVKGTGRRWLVWALYRLCPMETLEWHLEVTFACEYFLIWHNIFLFWISVSICNIIMFIYK